MSSLQQQIKQWLQLHIHAPLLKLQHGWVITEQIKQWLQLHIHAPLLVKRLAGTHEGIPAVTRIDFKLGMDK